MNLTVVKEFIKDYILGARSLESLALCQTVSRWTWAPSMILDRSLADDLSSGACCWRVPLLSSVAGKWKSSPEVTPGYRGSDVLQQILYQRRQTFRVLLSNK